jgi:hypothetical protein
MKRVLFFFLVLCAPGLLAQESPPAQNRPEQPAVAESRTQAAPAPQLGHPLDPADVDVLTGKTKAPTNAAPRVDPYAYAAYSGYPVNVASRSASRLGRTSGPLLLAGRAGNRSFFVIGNTGGLVPPLFFFTRGRGTGSTFFFAPVRTGFFFHR